MPNAEKQRGRKGGMPLTWVSTRWLKPRVAALGQAVGLDLFVPHWWQWMPAEIGGWGCGTSGGSSMASPGILRALSTSGPRGSRARWSSPTSDFSLAIRRASIPTTGCSCCSLPLALLPVAVLRRIAFKLPHGQCLFYPVSEEEKVRQRWQKASNHCVMA